MSLPNIIEFMTSLVRPSGGQLVSQAHRQDIIPFYPPGAQQTFTTFPATGTYANIVYSYAFGDMVPNVWQYSLNYAGWFVSNGVLTKDFLERPIDFFMIVTQKYPIHLTLINRDVVPHYWEANLLYLAVATQSDLFYIARALADKEGQNQYLMAIMKALKGEAPEPDTPTPVYVP